MANWNDTELVTTTSITQWEAEVNELSGYITRWALLGVAGGSPYTVTFDSSVTSVIVTKTNGSLATISATAGVVNLPTYAIIKIDAYVGATLFTTCGLSEGKDVTLFDAELNEVATLSSRSAWTQLKTVRGWQDKITLSRSLVRQKAANQILIRYPAVDDTDEAIDYITNAEVFSTACNMKALELIYKDLSRSGTLDIYTEKSKMYAVLFDREFGDALTVMRLSLTGDSEGSRTDWEGIITK